MGVKLIAKLLDRAPVQLVGSDKQMIVLFSPALFDFSPTHVFFLPPPCLPLFSNFSYPTPFGACSLLSTDIHPLDV